MVKDMDGKALAACREYAAASVEVRRLTEEIADSGGCERAASTMHDTHLSEVYKPIDDKYEGRAWLDADKELAPGGSLECTACFIVHKLVQERKKAKARLGKAKRNVFMIGSARK